MDKQKLTSVRLGEVTEAGSAPRLGQPPSQLPHAPQLSLLQIYNALKSSAEPTPALFNSLGEASLDLKRSSAPPEKMRPQII